MNMEEKIVKDDFSGQRRSYLEARVLVDDILNNGNLKFGQPGHKIFFYEMLPLVNFMLFRWVHNEGKFVTFAPKGNPDYDGIIFDGSKDIYIDCAYAGDTYQDSLRMEFFEKKQGSFVPAWGDMNVQGTKANRKFLDTPLVANSPWDDKFTERVREWLTRTLKSKAEKDIQLSEVHLLVLIDDNLLSLNQGYRYRGKIIDLIWDVYKEFQPGLGRYREIWFIGSKSECILAIKH